MDKIISPDDVDLLAELLELEKFDEAVPIIVKLLLNKVNIDELLYKYPQVLKCITPIYQKQFLQEEQLFEKKVKAGKLIDSLLLCGNIEKSRKIIDLFGLDELLEYIQLNEFSLPLYMEAVQQFFIEKRSMGLWSLAEKLEKFKFYKESKKAWQQTLELLENEPGIIDQDFETVQEYIKKLNSKIAIDTINDVINGNIPISELQKQQITKNDLHLYLGKIPGINSFTPKQKLVEIIQSRVQRGLVPSSKYKKIKLLGGGGFGKVWLVKDELGKKFALKQGIGKDAWGEIDYQSKLLKQVNKVDPVPTNLKYINKTNKNELIVQYLDGFITLKDYFIAHKDRCLDILKKVNVLVGNMHKKGISHRDLKRENIMIHPDTEELRIIDFGLGCIDKTKQYPCQNYRGTTKIYYPHPELNKNFKDWKRADKKAVDIIKKFC